MLVGFIPPELINIKTKFKFTDPVEPKRFEYFNPKEFFLINRYSIQEKTQHQAMIKKTIANCVKTCESLLSIYKIDHEISHEEKIISATNSWEPLALYLRMEEKVDKIADKNPVLINLETLLNRTKSELDNNRVFTTDSLKELLIDSGFINKTMLERKKSLSNLEKFYGKEAFTITKICDSYLYEIEYELKDALCNWMTSPYNYSNSFGSTYLVVDCEFYTLIKSAHHGDFPDAAVYTNYISERKKTIELIDIFVSESKIMMKELDTELALTIHTTSSSKTETENDKLSEIGRKVIDGLKKGAANHPQKTTKMMNKEKFYIRYDELMTSKPFLSSAYIKRKIAKELHLTARTMSRYLKERTK